MAQPVVRLAIAFLTFEAKAIEFAGNISDEALRTSEKVKFGDEISDNAVEDFIISFDCFWTQHVFPKETSHCLPLFPLTTHTIKKKK